MADRIPKPNTAIYLLRDIPRPALQAAHAALTAGGEGRTLKDALLDTIARLAAAQARRVRRRATPRVRVAPVAAPVLPSSTPV